MINGVMLGIEEGALEFIPDVLDSYYGISNGLWALVNDPSLVTHEFIISCNECIENLIQLNSTVILNEFVPEIVDLINVWDTSDIQLKGEKTGYVIGKYGVGIFASFCTAKCIQAYEKICKINQLCTLKAFSKSEENALKIAEQAHKRLYLREDFLNNGNLKIHFDRQNKHVPGKHNYCDGRSIFDHPDPQSLINKFAGTGNRLNKEIPGTSGYKELVDFQEYIGIWKTETGDIQLPTTRGTIHYNKNGVHIVPAEPK
jgi:hypothetical protein